MWKTGRLAAVTITVLAVTSIAPHAGHAQSGYQRPTTGIFPGSLTQNVSKALAAVCKEQCKGSRLWDRTFAEGVITGLPATDSSDFSDKTGAKLLAKLNAGGVARTFLLRQFQADKDFGWKNDLLKTRAEYALTTEQVSKLVRAQTGVDPQVLGPVPASFLFLVHATKEEIKDGKGLLGTKTYDASTTVSVALFKLGYKDTPAVSNALSGFWCGPDGAEDKCTDRAAKRAKFEQYTVPLEYVTTYTATVSGSVDQKAGQDSAWIAVASDLLDELVDETASRVTAFAVQEKIFKVDPPAARIGKKEGVKVGSRYFVINEESTNGTSIEKRGAMLLAAKVADNRSNAFERGAVATTVKSIDSTTFKQAYPGEVKPGTKIREAPSAISIYVSALLLDGSAGLAGQLRDEGLAGLPLGVKVLASGSIVPFSDAGTTYSMITFGAGAGYEFMPLHGRLRMMPFLTVNRGQVREVTTQKTNADDNAGFWGADFGIDVGIRVSQTIEATATYKKVGLATIDASGNAVTGFGNGLQFGLRVQRGRWGF